jgi:ribosomal protein S18 acetylase RimI-like enzyme
MRRRSGRCCSRESHDADVCEMKRLYVKPQHRKGGLGRCLAESAIRCAEQLDYSRMVLDTLPSMAAAHALYETLGFREIERYYDNPLSGVRYLARELVGRGRDSA